LAYVGNHTTSDYKKNLKKLDKFPEHVILYRQGGKMIKPSLGYSNYYWKKLEKKEKETQKNT